jgi:hypothetical protein
MKGQWKKIAVIAIVLSFVVVGCGSNAVPALPPRSRHRPRRRRRKRQPNRVRTPNPFSEPSPKR